LVIRQKQGYRILNLVSSFAIASMLTSSSFASMLFTSSGGGTVRNGDDFTLGTSFTVNTSGNLVTALGIYDLGGAFSTDHQIDLWDDSAGGAIVAAATFLASNTNAGTPTGFVFVSINPVPLVIGHVYTLGAFYPSATFGSGGDTLLDHNGAPATDSNFGSFAARFDTSGAFAEPKGPTSGTAYIGPNLQFIPAPEPATVGFVCFGLLGLLALPRQKRRV
jgi:hypothetical protein